MTHISSVETSTQLEVDSQRSTAGTALFENENGE